MATAAVCEMIAIFLLVLVLLANLYLWRQFPAPPKRDVSICYDLCIVLGCPCNADGSLSLMQQQRMKKAVQLYHDKKIKRMLISGGGVRNEYIEADIMAAYARKMGVPDHDLLIERKACNTFENLRYAKEVCQKQQYHHVVVITSPFHIRRAAFFVRKFFPNYAMDAYSENDSLHHTIEEYFRMWNTLYYEHKRT